MIIALMCTSVVGWGCWLIHRVEQATPVAAPRATPIAAVVALEDDPDQWRAWTLLDERQLIRLLTDSAPRHRPATNSINNAVPQVKPKDTP